MSLPKGIEASYYDEFLDYIVVIILMGTGAADNFWIRPVKKGHLC